jgi:hypothetical protein
MPDIPTRRRWLPDGQWFFDIGMFCLIIAGLDYIFGDVRTPERLAGLGLAALFSGAIVTVIRRVRRNA